MATQQHYYGTGRRKSAVARVFLRPGKGKIMVNGKPVDEFFSRETGRMIVRQPLELANHMNTFDILVNVQVAASPVRRRGPPRHHARADRLRCGAEAGSQESWSRDARRARGRAKEGRSAQSPTAQTILQALTLQRQRRKAAFGRLFCFRIDAQFGVIIQPQSPTIR